MYVSELTNPSILFILMQDMFDCITLDKCEEMFSYLEERVALWKSVSYFVYFLNAGDGKFMLIMFCMFGRVNSIMCLNGSYIYGALVIITT